MAWHLAPNLQAAPVQPDAIVNEHPKPNGDFVGRPLARTFSERAPARSLRLNRSGCGFVK